MFNLDFINNYVIFKVEGFKSIFNLISITKYSFFLFPDAKVLLTDFFVISCALSMSYFENWEYL